jgi:hypothetical protein
MPIMPVEAMVDGLTDWEKDVVRAAFTSRGVPAGGRLRANKPYGKVSTFEQGCANYVWRMVCFDCVGHGKHVCMPICADFDVHAAFDAKYGRIEWSDIDGRRDRHELVRDMTKILDTLVSRVERKLPIGALKGVMRWGHALGML